MDEDAYADAENDDAVHRRFIRGWEPLIEGYRVRRKSASAARPSSHSEILRLDQASFTDTNFQIFFSMMVEVMVRPWEKMVLGMRFTEVGNDVLIWERPYADSET